MEKKESQTDGLTLLGTRNVPIPVAYNPDLIETFENRFRQRDFFVTFNCPEFTAVCPMTGQPDFGVIRIRYVPGQRIIESKSLKLYLFSFRNHGSFHEDCVNRILTDLVTAANPTYMEVSGKFRPRGGISINPYVNFGKSGTPWSKVAEKRLFSHGLNGMCQADGHDLNNDDSG
jgi:7-cyano-7-deazaguanine reductase